MSNYILVWIDKDGFRDCATLPETPSDVSEMIKKLIGEGGVDFRTIEVYSAKKISININLEL